MWIGCVCAASSWILFFFDAAATAEFYTLSLHDALPIYPGREIVPSSPDRTPEWGFLTLDRKSTRLNSSHVSISYAVFCLKKKTDQDVPVSSGAASSAPASGNRIPLVNEPTAAAPADGQG